MAAPQRATETRPRVPLLRSPPRAAQRCAAARASQPGRGAQLPSSRAPPPPQLALPRSHRALSRVAPAPRAMASPMGKLGQNLNVAGVSLFMRVVLGGQAPLALPHVSVRDITAVDWHSLRAAGFVGCVFDKDNTLTAPYGKEVHPPLRAALAECLEAFSGRAVLLSNSAGLAQYDPTGAEADALSATLGIPVLRHSSKKPGGSADALELHFGCPASALVMIGDRYFTDVVYGNRHGMLTIRPAPFAPRGDGRVVRAARLLEDVLVARWRRRGAAPPRHPRMPAPDSFARAPAPPRRSGDE